MRAGNRTQVPSPAKGGIQAAFAQALRHAECEHGPQEPLLPFAHFFYGLALRTMGRKDKGLEHVQRAREFLQDHHLRARLSILPDRERRLKEVLRRWSSSS